MLILVNNKITDCRLQPITDSTVSHVSHSYDEGSIPSGIETGNVNWQLSKDFKVHEKIVFCSANETGVVTLDRTVQLKIKRQSGS